MRNTVQCMRDVEYRWRRNSRELCKHGSQNSIDGYVGIRFVDRSRVCAPYVELGSLVIHVLYVDPPRTSGRRKDSVSALRFAGYRSSIVPHGVLRQPTTFGQRRGPDNGS
jgi:hypothetical protein